MPHATVHTINAPLGTAAARMPTAIVAAGGDVTLRPTAAGTWRWEAPAGSGTVELSQRTAATSAMVVTDTTATASEVADALAVELYGALERTWAPAVPSGPVPVSRRQLTIAALVVAVLVPALALVGLRVLSPPAPVDVAAAVTQFRNDAGTTGAPTAAGGDPATPGAGRAGGAAPPPATRPTRDDAGAPADPRAAEPKTAARDAGSDTSSSEPAQSSPAAPQRSASGSPQRSQREESREAPSAPDQGVYRYETSGYEQIDKPSSRHDYPAETTMTVRASDCGFVARWQPLEDRWDEMSICKDGADAFITAMSTHREFYGQQQHSDFRCPDSYRAWLPKAGATWSGRCTDGDSTLRTRGRMLGREQIRIGDDTVEALRFSLQGRITGESDGTWNAERWIDPDTGLLLRLEAETDATSRTGFGTVRYEERLSLQLLSTTPER